MKFSPAKTVLALLALFMSASTWASESEALKALLIPDTLPATLENNSFTVNPDRLRLILDTGSIPCRMIVMVDNEIAFNQGGPMLRHCGYVEDKIHALNAMKSEALKLNRKLDIDTNNSFIDVRMMKISETEIYDSRAMIRKLVELEKENAALKKVIQD